MSFLYYEKITRFKKSSQLPGAGGTRAWHHHGSHTPTSPRAVLLHSYYISTQTFPPPELQIKTYRMGKR